MRQWIGLLMLLLLLSPISMLQAGAGIARWDALPAIEVSHLEGAYAGTRVCPMCRHGYDAGLLVLLPSSTPPDQAAVVARTLQQVASTMADERFRAFLILTGDAPSPALRAAVRGSGRHWFVAHLAVADIEQASRDFRQPLRGRAIAYVFAQRRLLSAFDPLKPMPVFELESRYAMSFLRATSAKVEAGNPDTPKGRLWLAPDRLSSRIALAGTKASSMRRLCAIDANLSPSADALIGVVDTSPGAAVRTHWARSDAEGCVELRGAAGALHIQTFSLLRPMAERMVDLTSIPAHEPINVRSATGQPALTRTERIVGPPCEGCEAVFEGMPSTLSTHSRIAPATEPGVGLQLSGVVTDRAGEPRAGVVVYAYQTGSDGRYPMQSMATPAARHGRLRGWAVSDAAGRYVFDTVRPGGYPGTDIPQHIHLQVIEPGRCTYYLGDVLFTDDPRLSRAWHTRESTARGGSGIVTPVGNARSGWTARRDIRLGLNLTNDAPCLDPR